MKPELFGVKEGAAFLGCAESTLYERVREGKVPYIRLWGGRRKTAIRFTAELLEDYIRKNTIQVSSR